MRMFVEILENKEISKSRNGLIHISEINICIFSGITKTKTKKEKKYYQKGGKKRSVFSIVREF